MSGNAEEENNSEMGGIKRTKKGGLGTYAVVGIIVIALLGAAVFFILTKNTPANEEPVILKISGSTTVQPIISKAAEQYMDKHKNYDIQVSGGGSGVGVTAVAEGTVDIGMASRDLKSTEKTKYPNLKTTVIAKDGIAIIIHPSNPITKLTEKQIRGIYNGTYTNWQQLGGENKDIVVYNRESTSGTREFFWEHVMKKENFSLSCLEKNSNGAMKSAVEGNSAAIAYVGLGYLGSTVKAVSIDTGTETVVPSVENVLNGKYPISRALNLITNGEPKDAAKAFIDYLLSSEGQKIVADEGFVPVK